ncbi:MAG: hypothetical protein KIS86_02705 [Devosia sp.]|nr:hypothetical protein [Devosia sp.]
MAATFPDGEFDLVTALFFQVRLLIFPVRQCSSRHDAVASGGLLLIVEHASAAPWLWSQDAIFPTAEETLSSLQLAKGQWTTVFVGTPGGWPTGRNSQTAMVKDNVLALRRR